MTNSSDDFPFDSLAHNNEANSLSVVWLRYHVDVAEFPCSSEQTGEFSWSTTPFRSKKPSPEFLYAQMSPQSKKGFLASKHLRWWRTTTSFVPQDSRSANFS